VNRQQTRHLRTIDDTCTPSRDALIEDLQKAVKQWIEDGEHPIIGMDANEDVRTRKLTKMLREQGLHNAILSKRPHISSVTTCERTEKDLPIDAIMTTFDTNDHIQAGYLAFDEGAPGDHQTLWMDIPFELIFGNNPPYIQGVDAIPVAVKDPRVRGVYNKRVLKVYIKYGILEWTRHVKQAHN